MYQKDVRKRKPMVVISGKPDQVVVMRMLKILMRAYERMQKGGKR